MPLNSAILFRFHRIGPVELNRLQLIRLFNPRSPIFGVFGGEDEELASRRHRVDHFFADLYSLPSASAKWKWKNGDLMFRRWFIERGKDFEFERLLIFEWDLLLLEGVETAYGRFGPNEVVLSGVVPLEEIRGQWSWTQREEYLTEWQNLLDYVAQKFGFQGDQRVGSIVAAQFPRDFLEAYAQVDVPDFSNDEMRVPLFAEILGFELADTGYYQWLDFDQHRFFNVDRKEIEDQTILDQLKQQNGRRAFHPYRRVTPRLTPTGRLFNIKHTIVRWLKRLRDLGRSSKLNEP